MGGLKMQTEQELKALKETVDYWIKDINSKLNEFKPLAILLKETVDNTEHNYELSQEMRQEIEELKQEIKLLKIIQLTMLKAKADKPIRHLVNCKCKNHIVT